MKRIILFRYHHKPYICRDRLLQLKHFNPKIEIFGLYGGKESEFSKYKKLLAPYLKHNYCIKNKSDFWKWKNSDLTVRLWYKNIGKNINFDMLHLIEWDLLLFNSLDKIYKNIQKNSLGLTALNPLNEVNHNWTWIRKEPYKSQCKKLIGYIKTKFKSTPKFYASLGPGICLPKNFLDKYSSVHIPNLSNDEVRLPLFAQVFKFKLLGNSFYKGWRNPDASNFFNCNKNIISLEKIKKELNKKGGRRVFHPYQKKLKNILF